MRMFGMAIEQLVFAGVAVEAALLFMNLIVPSF
jgi:hypothetical protein